MSSGNLSIDSEADEDSWSSSKFLHRRASLRYSNNTLGSRNSFHNRSLQDFSSRTNVNVKDQLEFPRKRQSAFIAVFKEETPPPVSTVNSDTVHEEWKQVKDEHQRLIFSVSFSTKKTTNLKFVAAEVKFLLFIIFKSIITYSRLNVVKF